ncbi:hypothetical protein [Brevibacillus sp. SYSU BS000544]|uniref:hypothetical protein n=1 Tax=Brevibacillus sp. SYSU BS000544 TaxID=3416443 RepID=UPI003CE58AA7
MIEKTRNYSLHKPDKGTRNWHTYLNENADVMDAELIRQKEVDEHLATRIDIIVGSSGMSNTEIVDARKSTLSGKIHDTLNGRLEEAEGRTNDYHVTASNRDSNGLFTVIEYKRNDATKTLYARAKATDPDENGNYQTIAVEYFAKDGVTLVRTITFQISYDEQGFITKKEVVS